MIQNKNKEKRHGLLINITGNGKGKTTSALGTAMRALGWGWKVKVVQFVKSSVATGEKKFADSTSLPFELTPMGAGLTWKSQYPEAEHSSRAQAAWVSVKDIISDGSTDLLILDELNIALQKKWLPLDEVIKFLRSRPAWQHIIITGRYALPAMIEACDLVSEIQEIKHPYKAGIQAQKGIDF
ncbi:cob(I)yrinic acid a,c-diamide adenosyltransferase [Lentisphaerota bacterium ZTH]|nr:cob(I)yrinic acid a,c-diamide adenosyltransferase [Lentisphaerota bacterium]WET07547.1 cob(I)yrinic acid a,c-diamide adenosyltransferase [Lentisphaerota bacterium ZTH]